MKSILSKNSTLISPLFYFGTLFSSIGNMTFTICLVAFMFKAGYDLFHASLIIGLCRLISILCTTFFGQKTDSLPPKLTVMLTEIGGAIGSIGILWGWSLGKSGYSILLTFSILRAVILSLQIGSRARIVKELASADYKSQSRHAVLFNKVTQGSIAFAGVIAWIAISNFSFVDVILFDAATFLINGIILLCLPLKGSSPSLSKSESIFKKFRDLYKWNPKAAALDLMLALMMMGTVSFTARLAGDNQQWLSIFMISYGVSVWVSGYIEQHSWMRKRTSSVWATFGLGYLLLGLFPGMGMLTWSICLLKDVCYWILFHRISSYIQADTPAEVIGSVSTARAAQMIIVLAIGELTVGAWQNVIPISVDGLWRGIIGISIAAMIIMRKKETGLGEVYERPAL